MKPQTDSAPPLSIFAGSRIDCTAHGQTAIVRLFNPNQGLMDEAMEGELMQVLDLLHDRQRWPEGRVVVLTGRDPGVFVRHYDVAVLHQRAQAMAARGKRFSLDRPVPPGGVHRCIDRIEASELIFIAAINGLAMGGGFELALGCDLRVVQTGDFQLGLPELNLGLLPGAGGTQALARLLGTSASLHYLLTAHVFSPQELVELRLAGACVDDALNQALIWARQLEAVPARACAHIKQLVRQGPAWDLERARAAERTLFCDCMVDPAALPLMADVAEGRRTIADAPLAPKTSK
jgi:enoyl-CoA hydratase/carnithine racemase